MREHGTVADASKLEGHWPLPQPTTRATGGPPPTDDFHLFRGSAMPRKISQPALSPRCPRATVWLHLQYAEAVLARLSLDTGSRAPEAGRRVSAARTLLLDPIHQHNLATRLIQVGLQPVTRHLDCPVNAAAVAKYIRDAGHAADAPRQDGHGTLRERACKFMQSLNGKATVRIAYWHSLLGAELIASGFVVASREYACPNIADPFRGSDFRGSCATSPFQSMARISMIQQHTHAPS